MDPADARQAVLAYLNLSQARAPGEGGEGPILALRRARGGWVVELRPDGVLEDSPARRLRVREDGVVVEEPTDPEERRRQRRRKGTPPGRRKATPEGGRSPRLTFTPAAEDGDAIERLAAALEVPEAELVRRLVRRGLRQLDGEPTALAELRRLAELLPAIGRVEEPETMRTRIRALAERVALALREIEEG